KIDIIPYSEVTALYLAESLRPAHVLGIKIVDEKALPTPKAIAVVNDGDDYSVAIGRKGANARLANRLTGWNIDILEESKALEEGIDYIKLEELRKMDEEVRLEREREAYRARSASLVSEEMKATPAIEENLIEIDEDSVEDEEYAPVEENKTEEKVEEPAEETKLEEEPAKPEKKETKVEEPIIKPKEPVQTTEVKTTTTLEDLEKELEKSKKETGKKGYQKGGKRRPPKITEEEVEHVKPTEVTPAVAMPIYSQEEIEQFEREEAELEEDYEYDDTDIDQYDEYYDDDDK
nr:hypothetical protein [Bacilli bacterium]